MITLKAYAHDTERLKVCAAILEALGESFVGEAKDKVLAEIVAIMNKREPAAK
jgi:hypothetical protein